MPWVRIDEEFARHPKVVKAGPLGMAMHVAALCYCNQYLTDGFVPKAVVVGLLDLDGIGMRQWMGEVAGGGVDATWELVVQDLEDASLWERVEGGWRIHDYHEYQPSREHVLQLRETRKAVGAKGGKASGEARRNQPRSKLLSKQEATAEATDEPKTNPGPVPVPPVATTGRTPAITVVGTPDVEQARPIDDTTAVFTAWQEATRKHRAQLDPKRRRRINAALKHYPLQDVLDAVQGWQHSPHHCGQNNSGTVYNDLDLLLRDASHIETFRDLWRDGPPVALGPQTTRAANTYRQMQAMGEGVNDDLAGMDRDRRQTQRQLPPSAG